MMNNTSYSLNPQTDDPIINSTQAITAIVIASISLLSSLLIHYKLKHMKCCCIESDCINEQDLGNPARKTYKKSLSGILKKFLNKNNNNKNNKNYINDSPNESIKSDDTEIVIDYLKNSHIDEKDLENDLGNSLVVSRV
jgi:hypothetical protein